MAEYIEREAFIKRLENEADKSSDIINLLILNGIANIVRDENIAPAADVVEVVHGEWVYKGIADMCSICGRWLVIEQASADLNYCPNCGAKMDGERKDGEENGL